MFGLALAYPTQSGANAPVIEPQGRSLLVASCCALGMPAGGWRRCSSKPLHVVKQGRGACLPALVPPVLQPCAASVPPHSCLAARAAASPSARYAEARKVLLGLSGAWCR